MAKKNFTPTEELILDVLISRRWLGENMWTFSTDLAKKLSRLESLGFIFVTHGVVEHTLRARLTDAGVKEFLEDATYKSPLELQLEDRTQEVLVLRRLLAKEPVD